jgi:hypothetical protein
MFIDINSNILEAQIPLFGKPALTRRVLKEGSVATKLDLPCAFP